MGLVAALSISASVADSSPFSTNGAPVVANSPKDKQDTVYRQLMIWGFQSGPDRTATQLDGSRVYERLVSTRRIQSIDATSLVSKDVAKPSSTSQSRTGWLH